MSNLEDREAGKIALNWILRSYVVTTGSARYWIRIVSNGRLWY